MAEAGGTATVEAVRDAVDLPDRTVAQVVRRLDDAGALEVGPDGEVATTGAMTSDEAAEVVAAADGSRRAMQATRLGAAADAEDAGRDPFPPGMAVTHGEFGDGQVMRADADRIVVLFDDAGYRTLSLPAVVDGDLLDPAG